MTATNIIHARNGVKDVTVCNTIGQLKVEVAKLEAKGYKPIYRDSRYKIRRWYTVEMPAS